MQNWGAKFREGGSGCGGGGGAAGGGGGGPGPAGAGARGAAGRGRAGRDPASLGMEGRLRWQQDRDKLAAAMRQWQDADATHQSVNTMGAGLNTLDDHL